MLESASWRAIDLDQGTATDVQKILLPSRYAVCRFQPALHLPEWRPKARYSFFSSLFSVSSAWLPAGAWDGRDMKPEMVLARGQAVVASRGGNRVNLPQVRRRTQERLQQASPLVSRQDQCRAQ